MGGLVGIRSSCTAGHGKGASRIPDGTGTAVMSRWSPPTPLDGDVAGTHNGLRSHGHGRCLVISRTLVARLPLDTYRRELGNVDTREPEQDLAVNQLAAKNGESEN